MRSRRNPARSSAFADAPSRAASARAGALALAPSVCSSALAVALSLLGGGLALAGCGSSETQTVSVSGNPPAASGRNTARAGSPNTTSTKRAVPNGGAPSGGAPSRTAPRPAFAQRGAAGEGQSAIQEALATVKAHGYTPTDASQYHAGQTLQVLVGTRGASAGAHDQQAFFFVNGRYIGTDAREPSKSVAVADQSDTEVALVYSLYRPSDPACCPGGGHAKVRFQLDNGRLVALDPIPPVSSASGPARQ